MIKERNSSTFVYVQKYPGVAGWLKSVLIRYMGGLWEQLFLFFLLSRLNEGGNDGWADVDGRTACFDTGWSLETLVFTYISYTHFSFCGHENS